MTDSSRSVKGLTVLVTGAASGMGRAVHLPETLAFQRVDRGEQQHDENQRAYRIFRQPGDGRRAEVGEN